MIWGEAYYARGFRDEGDVVYARISGVVTAPATATQTVTAGGAR
jgi:hypothetical protein